MAHLSHIGNSLGVRIPKAIIQQVGFKEDTNLVFKVTDAGLLISPVREPREGWEEAFKTTSKKQSNKQQKEQMLMGDNIVNDFDKDEWTW